MPCSLICHISRVISFVLYHYSKFGTKITRYCLGDVRIQFKKTNKEETLKNSAAESLAKGF